jgi:hypothetical protein
MNSPMWQAPPTMFYPPNLCGHLRGPCGACIGFSACQSAPGSADKPGELLVQPADELHAASLPIPWFDGEHHIGHARLR